MSHWWCQYFSGNITHDSEPLSHIWDHWTSVLATRGSTQHRENTGVQLWTRLCARTVCRETRQQLCWTKPGAIDAAALSPFNKHAHGHGHEKKKSSLFWLWFLWSVQFPENHYNYCQKMSYFKAKMHQVRFRLGLCTRSRWASLQCSLRLSNWVAYLLCVLVSCLMSMPSMTLSTRLSSSLYDTTTREMIVK